MVKRTALRFRTDGYLYQICVARTHNKVGLPCWQLELFLQVFGHEAVEAVHGKRGEAGGQNDAQENWVGRETCHGPDKSLEHKNRLVKRWWMPDLPVRTDNKNSHSAASCWPNDSLNARSSANTLWKFLECMNCLKSAILKHCFPK